MRGGNTTEELRFDAGMEVDKAAPLTEDEMKKWQALTDIVDQALPLPITEANEGAFFQAHQDIGSELEEKLKSHLPDAKTKKDYWKIINTAVDKIMDNLEEAQ